MQKIQFFDYDKSGRLRNKKKLKAYILELIGKENKNIKNINYIFCSDRKLLKINRAFLKHDYYTDVISFNLSEQNETIEGEIYISIDRVFDNSVREKVSFKKELHRVIFHGTLHLCGYKDKKMNDMVIMKKREEYYLKEYLEK